MKKPPATLLFDHVPALHSEIIDLNRPTILSKYHKIPQLIADWSSYLLTSFASQIRFFFLSFMSFFSLYNQGSSLPSH